MAKKTSTQREQEQALEDLGLDSSFRALSDTIKPRVLMVLTGRWYSGRSHFALGAPGDIVVFNRDNNLDGVSQFYTKRGKRIYSVEYKIEAKVDPKFGILSDGSSAEEAWEKCAADIKKVARGNRVRSMVLDKEHQIYDMIQLARLGRLQNNNKFAYGPVKAEYGELLRIIKDESDCNLILIDDLKKQYVNDSWNGKFERDGFKDLDAFANVIGRMERDQDDGQFKLTVEKCTLNADVTEIDLGDGKGVFKGPHCNFQTLMGFIFPEVDASHWE